VSLLLADALLPSGSRVDVRIEDERIASIVPAGEASAADGERIELDGALLIPALVDGHVHLDKTLVGVPWVDRDASGSVAERIRNEKSMLRAARVPVAERAERLAHQLANHGTGHIRTHVDIDPEVGLHGLNALVEVRERCRDLLDIEIVAFPQSGIVTLPGVPDLLDAALREGAAVVGGLDPQGLDGDASAHLDVVFGLAERHGVAVDIHLHDQGEQGTAQLREIARRTRALGLEGRVGVAHAFALGTVGPEDFAATARALADARVSIMTSAPPGLMPPVMRLRDDGVTVYAASDNIRDSWSPYGAGDVLERATTVAYQAGFTTDAELQVAYEMVTTAAAEAIGVAEYGIAPGLPANLTVVDARSVAEAVAAHPPRVLVLHVGRIVMARRWRAAEPA
jgi:cytosine deaminase